MNEDQGIVGQTNGLEVPEVGGSPAGCRGVEHDPLAIEAEWRQPSGK